MRTRSLVRFAFAALALFAAAGDARADLTVHITTPPILFCGPGKCLPDLYVRPDVELGQQGFRIYNLTQYSAGAFKVWVLSDSGSYEIDVSSLPGNDSQGVFYAVDGITCGETVTIIVNPNETLAETNYNNNVASYTGWCTID